MGQHTHNTCEDFFYFIKFVWVKQRLNENKTYLQAKFVKGNIFYKDVLFGSKQCGSRSKSPIHILQKINVIVSCYVITIKSRLT